MGHTAYIDGDQAVLDEQRELVDRRREGDELSICDSI